jgi:predicted dehydrogenase
MGAGIYTARKIIQSDLIGDIVGASAFMMCPGHERWHPSPEFYYKLGGGPLFDMGPYYITALVNLIGPVQSVCGMSNCLRKHREIKSEPKNGEIIDVEVDTHINALLRFENGAVGNMIMSFDAYGSTLPRIEIYGTKGSLVVPDPNGFGGEVLIKQNFDTEFHTYPLLSAFSWNARGMGVSEMADCLIHGKVKNCANGEMALHVLEIMEKILKSNDLKKEIELESTFVRLEGSTIFG